MPEKYYKGAEKKIHRPVWFSNKSCLNSHEVWLDSNGLMDFKSGKNIGKFNRSKYECKLTTHPTQ